MEAETVAGSASLRVAGRKWPLLEAKKWAHIFLALEARLPIGTAGRQALEERVDGPSFAVAGAAVFLVLPEGDEPPERAELVERLDLGFEQDGTWRVRIGGVVADGMIVLPGEREEIAHDVPPRSALSFTTLALGAEPLAGEPGKATFRLYLDGELLFEDSAPLLDQPRARARTIDLGASARAGARLTFEVDGPAGLAAFLNPRLHPRDVGTRGARPWDEARRDVVLVVADTFRADNLAPWGGDPELAPHLNALAARSRVFLQARSAACWTLPSHAAMFTGLYPRQLGVVRTTSRLDPAAPTIAERLRDEGYRTVAVTESALVSRTCNLDQGFEWFEEHDAVTRGVAATVEAVRAQLEVDDGRPLFLFVHSYRAHMPYVVSEATRARLGERYAFPPTVHALVEEAARLVEDSEVQRLDRGRAAQGVLAEKLASMQLLYRGASADLDAAYGELLVDLAGAGLLEHGALVFTSDHGEAFGEHGVLYHMSCIWDEVARVPLVVHAPGLSPGVEREPVSLIDLPRTLCALAGVDPRPEWLGRSILAGRVGAGPHVRMRPPARRPGDRRRGAEGDRRRQRARPARGDRAPRLRPARGPRGGR